MPGKFKTIFLGTPEFACDPLRSLVSSSHFDVVEVYTQPDRPAGRGLGLKPSAVKALALELGLSVSAVENINDPSVLSRIQGLSADVAVVVAFGQILCDEFLKMFDGRAVNIHSSLLPRWRGAAPMQRAILAGDVESGVTLQRVVSRLDAGDIIGERRVALTDDMNLLALSRELSRLGGELLSQDLVEFMNGTGKANPQDETKVTVAKKIRKEEGLLNFADSARMNLNKIRALWPWPGTWTLRGGKVLKIRNANLVNQMGGVSGEVLCVNSASIVVACGEGALEIFEVQPESRSKQTIDVYLRGYPIQKGEIFGR